MKAQSVSHCSLKRSILKTHNNKITVFQNSRVVMWSFFEAFVLLTMTAGQVYYLKRLELPLLCHYSKQILTQSICLFRFFEVRRVV